MGCKSNGFFLTSVDIDADAANQSLTLSVNVPLLIELLLLFIKVTGTFLSFMLIFHWMMTRKRVCAHFFILFPIFSITFVIILITVNITVVVVTITISIICSEIGNFDTRETCSEILFAKPPHCKAPAFQCLFTRYDCNCHLFIRTNGLFEI